MIVWLKLIFGNNGFYNIHLKIISKWEIVQPFSSLIKVFSSRTKLRDFSFRRRTSTSTWGILTWKEVLSYKQWSSTITTNYSWG